jgi:hypothetical protein
MPVRLGLRDLEPGDASRRATVWACDAAGVQEQNPASLLVSRNVRMTMQHNIDIVRRSFRWNVHEPKLPTFTHKIDNQRPILVPIAISAHHRERWTDRFQLERDRRFANIAQMPNLICLPRKIDNLLRQLVVRVCQHKNPKHQCLRKAGTQEWKDRFGILPAFLLSSAILSRVI